MRVCHRQVELLSEANDESLEAVSIPFFGSSGLIRTFPTLREN